jgi:hypothetical protein
MRLPAIGLAPRTLPVRADSRRKRHGTGKSLERLMANQYLAGKHPEMCITSMSGYFGWCDFAYANVPSVTDERA